MCLVFLHGVILYGTFCASCIWFTISFSMLGKFSTIISSKIFSSSGTPIILLVHLILSQRSLRLYSVLFTLFTLLCSSEVISTILSSSLLIHSSASAILLLILSRVFLNFSNCVVSVCLFFNYFRSLLIDSCIFSILFSRFLIIFTIIILNYFSGSLPISSSFIWTSVFLVCSFICVVFLCFFFFFNLFCLWSPFPNLQGKLNSLLEESWFLTSLWLLPSYGWSSGLCKLPIGWHLGWGFVCFSSDRQGWLRWLSCLWMIGFVFLLLFFFRGGVLHRVLLVVGWWWVLYSSGLVCVSLHYLILPRVSSLIESRVFGVLPLQRLMAWSLVKNEDSTSGLLWIKWD